MPDRSSKKKPTSKDANELAKSILDRVTNEDEAAKSEKREEPKDGKDPLAVELGRRGGLKGGKARAAKLTKEERRAIAKKAAEKRWGTRNDHD